MPINGHIFVIEALLDYHAEINRVSTKTGETPLIHAAKNGKWESVRLLLESGADVHMRDNTGRTATDWAREKNFAGVMKRLSEYQSHYQVKAKTARGRAVELFCVPSVAVPCCQSCSSRSTKKRAALSVL